MLGFWQLISHFQCGTMAASAKTSNCSPDQNLIEKWNEATVVKLKSGTSPRSNCKTIRRLKLKRGTNISDAKPVLLDHEVINQMLALERVHERWLTTWFCFYCIRDIFRQLRKGTKKMLLMSFPSFSGALTWCSKCGEGPFEEL